LPSSATPARLTDLPILIADVPSVLSDFDLAPDGKYFLTQYRNNGANAESGLWVVDPTLDADMNGFADIVWDSKTAAGIVSPAVDLLIQSRAVKVSPDNRMVATMRDDNTVMLMPLVNGVPDIANRRVLNTGVTTTLGRDLTFDAANNLYIASSGQGAVKAFSPGFGSRAVTGSDGTFTVTNFIPDTTVTLSIVDSVASEPGPDTAEFSLTRSGDASQPLSLRLTYSGTAAYGVDYTGAPTNVTFEAGISSTNFIVTVVDDTIGEATETMNITLPPGTNYFTTVTGATGSISIADNGDPASISLTAVDTNIYERMTNDTARFAVTRAGDSSFELTVNVSYAGTAVETIDYISSPTSFTIPAGSFAVTNSITNIDNTLLDGNRTIVVRVEPGAGYVPGAANTNLTVLIRDDELAALPGLFSEDFDTDHSGNYTIRFGADNNVDDKLVDFNFDYSSIGLPPAPHSSGGTTRGLKLTANKDGTASAAGVNVYPNAVSFSNEYVLRFDMYHTFDSALPGTTEHAIFGLNHSSTRTNRALSAGGLVGGDGVWAAIESDGSASSSARSYAIFGSTNAAVAPPFSSASARTFDTFFTTPPFKGIPGGAPSGQWSDVELSQTNLGTNVVITLKINAVTILARTNNTAFTNGAFMLGYMDSFASIGSVNNFVVYDNVRVENLTSVKPRITAIRDLGNGTIEIDFTADPADAASAYTLESSTTVTGGYATDPGSSIVASGNGNFTATSPNGGGPQRFYRIKK
jgi:hypothetical protein